jgi:6-phosphogluconolactonase (cycloisomerase 2 family)
LTGCKGFWDKPSSSGGGGGGSTTLTSGFFYVLNTAKNELVGLYVNKGVTSVIPNCTSNCTFSLGATPLAIAVSPNNSFLYVSTLGGIFVYSINASTGQLTVANNGHVISGDFATSMQVDATNSWLVEGLPGAGKLFAVPLVPSTGLPPAGSDEAPVTLPSTGFQQVAISPDNTRVLVAMGSGGTATMSFTSGNANPFGAVGTFPTVSTAGGALSVAFDPIVSPATTPRLFYIGETVAVQASATNSNTGGLRAFNFSTGKEITGSPFAISGNAPVSILPISTGSFVYVLNKYTSSGTGVASVIAGFSVSDTNNTPALTALGSTFATGISPEAMVEDSSGQFVFAVNFQGSPDLIGYTFNATTAGNLDKVISSATGTEPAQALAIAALHPTK